MVSRGLRAGGHTHSPRGLHANRDSASPGVSSLDRRILTSARRLRPLGLGPPATPDPVRASSGETLSVIVVRRSLRRGSAPPRRLRLHPRDLAQLVVWLFGQLACLLRGVLARYLDVSRSRSTSRVPPRIHARAFPLTCQGGSLSGRPAQRVSTRFGPAKPAGPPRCPSPRYAWIAKRSCSNVLPKGKIRMTLDVISVVATGKHG